MSLQLFADLYLAAAGLIVGSYLNVVIHRLPRRSSTVLPRSRCPHCNALIRGYDNIPLISYLVLRGRCRECRTKISWRYPLVEAVTAITFVLSFESFGATWITPVALLFSCLMIVLAGIDAEHYILPDRLTWPGMAIGFALSLAAPWIRWQDSLLGIVLGGGVLWIVSEVWFRLQGVEGLGLGDVKMLAMIGSFLGWQGGLVTLVVSSLAGTLVGLVLISARRMSFGSRLPFGVFLAFGGLVALFAGDDLLRAYSRFF